MTPVEKEKIIVYADIELQEIIPLFLDNKQQDIQTIEQAIQKQDYHTIQVLGHRMKGAGGGYGFDVITQIGAEIEESAQAHDEKKIRELLQRLSDYLARVEVVYKESH